jgi:hypothetical protein
MKELQEEAMILQFSAMYLKLKYHEEKLKTLIKRLKR